MRSILLQPKLLVLAAATVLIACRVQSDPHSEAPILSMEELRRWNMDSFPAIERAHLGDEGQIVVIFDTGKIGYLPSPDGVWTMLSTPMSPVAVSTRSAAGKGSFEFRAEGCTFTLVADSIRASPTCERREELSALVDAVVVPNGPWLEQHLSGDSVKLIVAGTSRVFATLQVSDQGRGAYNSVPFISLDADTAHVLLWSRDLPLRVDRIAVNDGNRRPSPTQLVELPELEHDTASSWSVLRPVLLGTHWLVVVADLRSDKRILALLSDSARVVRSRVIESPIGFLSANTAGRLLAISDLSSRELVLYCWTIGGSLGSTETEGVGFAKCVDAPFGSEGHRTCSTAGSSGCHLNHQCIGNATEAHRVTPSGRVTFDMAVLLAYNPADHGSEHLPVRAEACSGIIFRLQYTDEAAKARLLEQRSITL